MDKRQKSIIIFSLAIILSILMVVAFVYTTILLEQGKLSPVASIVIGTISAPIISQSIGMIPKIIHYRKVKVETQKIEKLQKKLESTKTSSTAHRKY